MAHGHSIIVIIIIPTNTSYRFFLDWSSYHRRFFWFVPSLHRIFPSMDSHFPVNLTIPVPLIAVFFSTATTYNLVRLIVVVFVIYIWFGRMWKLTPDSSMPSTSPDDTPFRVLSHRTRKSIVQQLRNSIDLPINQYQSFRTGGDSRPKDKGTRINPTIRALHDILKKIGTQYYCSFGRSE